MTIGIWRVGRRGAVTALAAMVLGAGCGSATAAVPGCETDRDDGTKRILFIGNSLTYTNGLPYLFAALADSAGVPAPVVEQIALPDFGLEQHWEDGQAARAIRDGCWDVVVLQQGPSSLPESRVNLLDYAARYDALIRAGGARTALLSVWPAASRQGDFARSIESYALAADAVGGVLLPAGTAWLQAWERDPALALYADGLHPSREGSWLAAAVMVGRLYARSPLDLPAGVEYRIPREGAWVIRLEAGTARVLREAARAALELHPGD